MSFLKDLENDPIKEVDTPVKSMFLQDAKDIYRPQEDINKVEAMKTSGKYKPSDFSAFEKYGLGFGMAFRGLSDLPEEVSLFGKNVNLAFEYFGGDKQEIERKKLNVITASRNLIKQQQERFKGVPEEVSDSFSSSLGAGAFNFSTALLGTVLGGPSIGLAINSALEFGSEVSARIPTTKEGEIDEKKITPEWAAKTTAGTVVYTGISALLENKIGITSEQNVWNKPITSTVLKKIVKEVGLGAFYEGATEVLQGGASAGIRLAEGTITLDEFGEEVKGLWKDFAVASILSSTVGTSVAINQRANLKRAIRKRVDLTVKDKNVSSKIADAIFEAGNIEINTLVSKELELSSELKNKHGLIYQNMGKAIDSAIKESGAFSDVEETELAEYVSDTSRLFADQVLAEANKRGTTIDAVINGADIKYEDGKIKLLNGDTVVAENKGVLLQEGKGYSGYSKSVNAVEAEAENRMPATSAAKKLGVTSEAIKEFLDSSEWHHYGKMYNKVNVYDINPYLLIKEGNEAQLKEDGYSKEEIQEFKETFEKMKKYKKPKSETKEYKANVEWIEWVNKKPVKHSLENVDVIEKGQFYTFKTKDGDIRKKIGSNGTSVISKESIKNKKKLNILIDKIKKINDRNHKKSKEGDYKKYLKDNNLDKPTFKEFEEFYTSTNYDGDNYYIQNQKPKSKEKEKGLRRVHKEGQIYQLQEWNGKDWKVIEEKKDFNPSLFNGKFVKSVYEFYTPINIPYTLEEAEEILFQEGKYKTESPEFKKWFGDSKVVDEQGEPLVVYHGSTKEFDTFDINKASQESDWGRGFYFTNSEFDVSENYEGGGPDFENRISRLAENLMNDEDVSYEEAEQRIREQEFDDGTLYDVYLKIENPVNIGGENETIFNMDMAINEDGDYDYDVEPTGSLVDLAYNLDSELADLGIDYNISQDIFALAMDYDNELTASQIENLLREKDESEIYTIDYESSPGEVLANAFSRNFDGIVDYTVNQKFGSERDMGRQMDGMDSDTVHYVVFDPTQIKSVDNEGTFNPKNDIIYKQGVKGSFNVSEKAIAITKNADYSTLPHELSHFWLDNIFEYTRTGSASPEYMENFKAIKSWLGIKDNQMNLTTKQQEKFARGYEKYLTEGSLPNRIIGNAFDNYDKWLKKVYKESSLKNKLPPETVDFFRTMTTGEFVEPKDYEPERTFEKNKEKTLETIEKDSKEIINEKQKQYKDEKEFKSTTEQKKGVSSVFAKQSERVDSNEVLEYDVINLEEQNRLAKEYVESNPEDARDVINGIKNPPKGIVKNAIYNAYLKQTLDVGDTEAYLDALKNQSLDLTKAGQEIVSQRGADDILSGSYWIKKIEEGRKKKIATKTARYDESFKDVNSIFEKKIDDAINNSLDKILKIKDAKEQQKQINILTDMISKDLNVKTDELFQKELKTSLNNKEALRKYIRNNLNEKLGISVNVKEADDILNKVEKVKKVAENTIDKNGNPSVEFFKRLRELEDFTNSLNPTNLITVFTSIIGRSSMLASIKSPIFNIASNAININLENVSRNIVRKLNNESLENKVSKEKQKNYLKYAKDVYNQSGFIVSDMEELETDMKVRGEKIEDHSQGKGVIRKIGRFFEKTVFKYLMGYPDVFAKDITFVKVAGMDATNIAIKEKAKDISKRAGEIFDDAIKIEPATEEGKKIRKNAIKEAKIVTFTQDSGLSKFALSLRNIFNKATGPIKLGNLNSPFVQVPANVYSLMLDYAFGSSKGLLNIKKIYNDFKSGELSDSSKDALRSTSRNVVGVFLSSVILSALIDDDDYIPDYALLTPSERDTVKAKNGVFNSVKIEDNYISLEAFGPLAMTLVSLLEARRRTGKRENLAGYFKGAGIQLLSMPVIGDIKDQFEKISRMMVEKEDKTLENLFDFSVDFLSARTIPAIVTDVAKSFDKYERDTMRSSINAVLTKIPLARENLPTKTNMITGEDIKTNPYQLLFGSRVKPENKSFEIDEIDRLNKNGYNVTITDPTRYGDLKLLSEKKKVFARKMFAEIYSEKIRKIMSRSSWDNLKDERKKRKLNEIRRKAVDVIKKEFKGQEE